jgi:hypothetical protein
VAKAGGRCQNWREILVGQDPRPNSRTAYNALVQLWISVVAVRPPCSCWAIVSRSRRPFRAVKQDHILRNFLVQNSSLPTGEVWHVSRCNDIFSHSPRRVPSYLTFRGVCCLPHEPHEPPPGCFSRRRCAARCQRRWLGYMFACIASCVAMP